MSQALDAKDAQHSLCGNGSNGGVQSADGNPCQPNVEKDCERNVESGTGSVLGSVLVNNRHS